MFAFAPLCIVSMLPAFHKQEKSEYVKFWLRCSERFTYFYVLLWEHIYGYGKAGAIPIKEAIASSLEQFQFFIVVDKTQTL